MDAEPSLKAPCQNAAEKPLAMGSWLFAKVGLLIGKCDGMKIVSPE